MSAQSPTTYVVPAPMHTVLHLRCILASLPTSCRIMRVYLECEDAKVFAYISRVRPLSGRHCAIRAHLVGSSADDIGCAGDDDMVHTVSFVADGDDDWVAVINGHTRTVVDWQILPLNTGTFSAHRGDLDALMSAGVFACATAEEV
jgi:hypothetical protein